MSSHIFQHNPSGEKFAVATDSYGAIVGANGPLQHREFAAVLAGDWDADPEMTAEWQEMDYIEAGYVDVTDDIRWQLAND